MRTHRSSAATTTAVALVALVALVAGGAGCSTSAPTSAGPGTTTATTPPIKTPGTTASTPTVTNAPGTSSTAPTVAAAPNQVTIVDFLFQPPSLSVPAGTEVVWRNSDGFDHWVLADDKTSFDSGRLAEGGTYAHTFATAGTFAYFCDIHNQMKGTIVVS